MEINQGFYIKLPPPPAPSPARPDCGTFDGELDGYTFLARKNFGGYDIPQPTVTRGDRWGDIQNLKAECDANSNCRGWNSFGDLKSKVEPLASSKWHVWSGFSQCEVRHFFF